MHMDATPTSVAVPVRGADCVVLSSKEFNELRTVAVPVRGADCVGWEEFNTGDKICQVAVPVRGADCVL